MTSLPRAAMHARPTILSGLVVRAGNGFYDVQADDGRLISSHLRGRLKQARSSTNLAVIGDRVSVAEIAPGEGVIEAVEPRRSRFSRRQPGSRGAWREDVLLANLDQVVVVFACADPMPHLRMLDRFLVAAEHNEVQPVVVANKVDLVGIDRAREIFGGYERIGYRVTYASAHDGLGIAEIADRLTGRISVVAGPSGVGKSTLLNAIQPGLHLATGAVSEGLRKGRHTTTTAELLPVRGGGYVADTPGLRELGLWRTPPEELAWCFPEFRPFLGECGFNDCRHLAEPRCAVVAAAGRGAIPEARLDSYRRLIRNEE